MAASVDLVDFYGANSGWQIGKRTVLVEGTTDAHLIALAVKLEMRRIGVNLFDDHFRVVAAGRGRRGGTNAVIRQLVTLRNLARVNLTPGGRPRYRFIGLFDNDWAGRDAIAFARGLDGSIREFQDVFLLKPTMPVSGNFDPKSLAAQSHELNSGVDNLDWEMEDLLSNESVEGFLAQHPEALVGSSRCLDKVHREFTRKGKMNLHSYIISRNRWGDVTGVVDLVRALRFYLALPPI